jgi:hypothetical protein
MLGAFGTPGTLGTPITVGTPGTGGMLGAFGIEGTLGTPVTVGTPGTGGMLGACGIVLIFGTGGTLGTFGIVDDEDTLSKGGVGILPGTGGIVELDSGGGIGIDDSFLTDSYILLFFYFLDWFC